jgi:hypothetical protein
MKLRACAIDQSRDGIDRHAMHSLRRAGRDFLDVHAPLGTRHQRDALRRAVDHHGDVELLADVGALLHQQAPHQAALRTGLVSHERHSQDLRRILVHLFKRLRHLDAAAFTAAAGMNLRLHHPDLSAELNGRGVRLGN